jgi:hypothetical protein
MSTAKNAPRVHFDTPEIRDLEQQLVTAEMAQAAVRNSAGNDVPVTSSAVSDRMGIAELIVLTKHGRAYALPSENRDGIDWIELPPVPGTAARRDYDVVQGLKTRIRDARAALGQFPDTNA